MILTFACFHRRGLFAKDGITVFPTNSQNLKEEICATGQQKQLDTACWKKPKKNPNIGIDANLLLSYRCKIKRIGFKTYNDACKEQKQMEMYSDTDAVAPKKRSKVDTSASDMFSKILSQSRNQGQTVKPKEVTAHGSPGSVDIDTSSCDGTNSDLDLEAPVQNLGTVRETMTPLRGASQSRSQPTTSESQEFSLKELFERVQNLENQLNRCLIMLSQINAKLDEIGSRQRTEKVRENADDEDSVDIKKNEFEPVKNLAELDAIEEKCKNDSFVANVVRSMGKIHGKHRFTGAGQTVCLQLIDYFIDRQFLRECSWTGVSKTKDPNGNLRPKIAFSKYSKFIDLFFQSVLNADELFTLESCHKFLKQCIRNSKQRVEDIKQVRASVSRKRGRKIVRDEQDLDDDDEEKDDNAGDEVPTDNSGQQSTTNDHIYSQEMIVEFLDETILKPEPKL
nr:uncharacterized protein LOC109399441 [Aedes albopictus]